VVRPSIYLTLGRLQAVDVSFDWAELPLDAIAPERRTGVNLITGFDAGTAVNL
jgi:hypothetical protein